MMTRNRVLIGVFTLTLVAGLGCTPETVRIQPTPTVVPTTVAPTTAAQTPTLTATPAPTASSSATVAPSASASPSTASATSTACPTLTGGSSPAGPRVAAVRAAHNPGFDRLVIEFTEQVVPQYEIKVASAFNTMTGQAIRIDGNAFFSVRVGGRAHTDDSPPGQQRTYPQADPYRPGLPLIREVKLVLDFEGAVFFGVGLERLACPTLLVLASPPRIVLDFPTPP